MIPNTFWLDFTIADTFGLDAIQDTFNRAFREWHNDYKMLTALVIVLNHKIWQHYENSNSTDNPFVKLYDRLWKQAQDYALTNLKGDELQYYYEITD